MKSKKSVPAAQAAGNPLRLLHELQVHQVELEQQNEELRRAQRELEVARARYFELYDLAPVGYLTVSARGAVLEANLAAAALLGVERRALAGKPFAGFVHPADRERVGDSRACSVEAGGRHSLEARMRRADGSVFWARLEAAPAPDGGCRITVSDISERKAIEDAQAFLVRSECLPSEKDFFHSIARYLGESLEMEFVCIDRLLGDELTARTLAVYSDGRFEDNIEYALKDTPCGEAVGKAICRFDSGVRRRFPRDAALKQLKAESYLGTTLFSRAARPIGLIAVIGRKPLVNPRRAEALLGLIAVRAAGELERTQAEERLEESEERYKVIVESSGDLIFFLDREGRLRWHNPASRGLIGQAGGGEVDLPSRVHPADAARFAAALRSSQIGAGQPPKTVHGFRGPDGGYRTLESTFRRITVGGEELRCMIATDVTELTRLRRTVAARRGIPGIVGRDPQMLALCASIRELADADVPVVIQGESGTGKELVAAAIHGEGPRSTGNFVAINCGAIPDALLETELFGHVKGAFTGAHRDKKGRFELADGGTIFLDEICELSHAMQVKLLRVLQEGTFESVGSAVSKRVDVRLISATNRDLEGEVASGRFREDLFYRIGVVPLAVPPLRERRADIPLLVHHVLEEEALRSDRRRDPARPPREVAVARETMALLLDHRWPGNVRELQNVLRFALIKCKGDRLLPEHLPPSLTQPASGVRASRGRKPKLTAEAATRALKKARGDPREAARLLGVSRATIYRHLPKTSG